MTDELLKTRSLEILERLDVEGKRTHLRELEASSMKEGFWSDSQAATAVMKRIASIQKEIDEAEMLSLLISDGTDEEVAREIKRLEFALYLSGTFDRSDAIFALHSGQGGTEAMDWTSMLYRMYLRFCERKGWSVVELDKTLGEEAGIKSVTIQVTGSFAYGFLKAESGVHRLVRQSPFNADNLRQTSFAMAEVLPVIEDTGETVIRDEDLQWDFYRAGGKGGQNVNKVSSAVRLTHTPSGIVVQCQAERDQFQNRQVALSMLRAKLWAREEEERLKEVTRQKGEYKTPGWGNQIRSYVLHPYHMVKDVRTQHETGDTNRVLDGDIEDFIMEYLKKTA